MRRGNLQGVATGSFVPNIQVGTGVSGYSYFLDDFPNFPKFRKTGALKRKRVFLF